MLVKVETTRPLCQSRRLRRIGRSLLALVSTNNHSQDHNSEQLTISSLLADLVEARKRSLHSARKTNISLELSQIRVTFRKRTEEINNARSTQQPRMACLLQAGARWGSMALAREAILKRRKAALRRHSRLQRSPAQRCLTQQKSLRPKATSLTLSIKVARQGKKYHFLHIAVYSSSHEYQRSRNHSRVSICVSDSTRKNTTICSSSSAKQLLTTLARKNPPR